MFGLSRLKKSRHFYEAAFALTKQSIRLYVGDNAKTNLQNYFQIKKPLVSKRLINRFASTTTKLINLPTFGLTPIQSLLISYFIITIKTAWRGTQSHDLH